MHSTRRCNLFPFLSLFSLVLLLAALPAVAQSANQCQTQPLCKATSAQPDNPFAGNVSIAGNPDPILRSIIGDCCPGNNPANCVPVSGYSVHCGTPHCETGEFSCLYNHL